MHNHPLLSESTIHLRRGAKQILENQLLYFSDSNIVFICGGNGDIHLRPHFSIFIKEKYPELIPLFPEHAVSMSITDDAFINVNLYELETYIASICQCIVLFPEGPGSYAEAGMFSVLSGISEKTLIALNKNYQHEDSFLSNGPALLLDNKSLLSPRFQVDYNNPDNDFDLIVRKILSRKNKRRTAFKVNGWREGNNRDRFIIFLYAMNFLKFGRIDHISKMIKSLTGEGPKKSDLELILSVALGCKIIWELQIDDQYYFHLLINPSQYFGIRDEHKEEYISIIDEALVNIENDTVYESFQNAT
ncbi:MAG: retron St85 family effector protein [Oceanicaulis sp.]|nr:retron St85 family effector protein [Oceanicaulis sp.]